MHTTPCSILRLVQNLDKYAEQVDSINLRKLLSLCSTIFKILASVTKDTPYVEYGGSFACFTNVLPSLFRSGYEFATSNVSAEFSNANLFFLLLEAFLHLVRTIICDSNVFQNILVSVILENLDVDVWPYDNIKLPVAYFCRIALYTFKLVEDINKQEYQALMKGLDATDSGNSTNVEADSILIGFTSERISLVKAYTVEELLKGIFPTSKLWVDSLMHLAFFLHHEGSVTNVNMPLDAASAQFIFLKTSVFSCESTSSIYEDARKKLNTYHIDIILAAHSCQGCYAGGRTSDVRKYVHAHEVCYEVDNLISFNALSRSLKDYLVCNILTIENGSFIYHTLVCRVDLSGNQFRTKVHKVFVEFVSEKVKSVCARCPSLNELIDTLPTVFHIEIFVMSFHLSSAEGKAVQADFIFSSIKTIEPLSNSFNSTHLSCWALLVSQLVLILGHIIFYPNVCPATLLSELKSKLKEAPLVRSALPGIARNRTFWASTFLEVFTIEGAVSSSFLNDVISFTTSACIEDTAVDCLGLNWAEVCSSFSWILEFWRGKRALTVVVEVSIFLKTSNKNYGSRCDHTEGVSYRMAGAGGGSKRLQEEEIEPTNGKRPRLEPVEQDPLSNLFPNLELITLPRTPRGILLERISTTGLVLQRTEGDGNCQFRSVSKVLKGTQIHYMTVRKKVVKEMIKRPKLYMDYGTSLNIPEWKMWDWSYYHNYVRQMAEDKEWGDFITLFAAANVFQVRIKLYCSYEKVAVKEFAPVNRRIFKDVSMAYTYYHREHAHYEALMPPEDIISLKPTPSPERKPIHREYQVLVKNIPRLFTNNDLRDLFDCFRVRSARVIYNRDGRSRGFGFVVLESGHMMEHAVFLLNGTLLGGRKIQVIEAMENYHDVAGRLE